MVFQEHYDGTTPGSILIRVVAKRPRYLSDMPLKQIGEIKSQSKNLEYNNAFLANIAKTNF